MGSLYQDSMLSLLHHRYKYSFMLSLSFLLQMLTFLLIFMVFIETIVQEYQMQLLANLHILPVLILLIYKDSNKLLLLIIAHSTAIMVNIIIINSKVHSH